MSVNALEAGQRLRYLVRGMVQRGVHRIPGGFIRQFIASPAGIGAICPSSPWLSRYMAAQVPLEDGLVVELGAGTGVVTQALLERGVPASKLLVVEFSPDFVRHLRERFPGVKVIHGNAAHLDAMLPPGDKVNTIVSSLPLCSLPPSDTFAIVQQWNRLFRHSGGRVVQFTYNLGRPPWQRLVETPLGRRHVISANIPPAQVFTLLYPGSPSSCPQTHVITPRQPGHPHN